MTSLHHWEENHSSVQTYQADTSNAGAAAAQAAMNKGKTSIPQYQDSSYVYDEASGYYYDSTAGMYYDPKTQYFYNTVTGQYLYWNGTCYVAHTEHLPDKKPEPKKQSAEAKAAKKIQRDMQKWAATQNSTSNEPNLDSQFVLQTPSLCEDVVNWTRLVCLLCRRQFQTRDVLEKHVQMSQLHARNLEGLNKGGPVVLPERKYRDRAKERRDKFGISDPPND